jgi:membrane-associated phospholipid phosphatase
LLAGALDLAALRGGEAQAAETPPAPWQPVTIPEGAVFAGVGAAYLLGQLAVPKKDTARWTSGGILMDDGVRDAIHARSTSGQKLAKSVSDISLDVMLAAPFVDAAGSGWWGRGDARLALHLGLIDAESYVASTSLIWGLKVLVRRERPDAHAAGCGDPSRASLPACSSDKSTSFPSSHSGMSFTAASLLCVEHLSLDLPGPPWAFCGAALATATATGMLRVVADKHYTSDILAGALIGAASGGLLPWLLHFRSPAAPAPAPEATATGWPTLRGVVPVVSGSQATLHLTGDF